MADSNITKRALANALKEQLEVEPFSKISISDICDRCEMNRKSFYYHFRDKYDLVNWLFDTEFTACLRKREDAGTWDFFAALCSYLYDNRSFYRKLLAVRGQDSFYEHLRSYLRPFLQKPLSDISGQAEVPPIYMDFFTDSISCALERWLLEKDCQLPTQFVASLKELLLRTARYVCEKSDA